MDHHRQFSHLFYFVAMVFAAIAQALCAADGLRAQTFNSDLYDVLAGHENLTDLLPGQPHEKKFYSGWPPHLVATRTVGGKQNLRYDKINLIVTVPESRWYDPNPWYDLNPNRNKPNVDVLIGRRDPTMIAALSAERVGIESNERVAPGLVRSENEANSRLRCAAGRASGGGQRLFRNRL